MPKENLVYFIFVVVAAGLVVDATAFHRRGRDLTTRRGSVRACLVHRVSRSRFVSMTRTPCDRRRVRKLNNMRLAIIAAVRASYKVLTRREA
jgi:hypothetical protein